MTRVSGTPSEQARPPGQKFDPPSTREFIRITNLYGTPWTTVADPAPSSALTQHLRLGRLAQYYANAQGQLPHVLTQQTLNPEELTFRRWSTFERLIAARLWIITSASGQAIVAVSLDVNAAPLDTIDLLEDCYYLDVTIRNASLNDTAAEVAARHGVACNGLEVASERHQLVYTSVLTDNDAEDVVHKLIYRSDLPYRREFSAISFPAELNRRPGTTVAVGPYVSVLAGQQDYVENCAFISAAQAVASSVRLRQTREAAYQDVRLFRQAEATERSLLARRRTLEAVADQLGELELELSYSVEAAADLGILVPSLRVVGYHNALFNCIGLLETADTVGRMLQRLDRSVRAELTAVESIERRADEDRRLRWTVAVGFLSTVALPITLVLTFFGINAREVDSQRSMFDSHYLILYLLVGAVVAAGLALSVGLNIQQRLTTRRNERRRIPRRSAALPANDTTKLGQPKRQSSRVRVPSVVPHQAEGLQRRP